MKNKKITIFIVTAIIAIVIGVSVLFAINQEELSFVKYKEFNEYLENGKISEVIIDKERIQFSKKDDETKYYTDNPNSNNLQEKLLLSDVDVSVNNTEEQIGFIFDLLFYLFFFAIVIFAMLKFTAFTGNSFKIIKNTNTKFDDIAGMDSLKKEMMKTVEILKNPKEYSKKGIRGTKGIILEGTPGNGKTLFAKALAGEANVNFIATRGADFQSAMMSMGARKIKTLFKKARKHKPCIIFIDEFDGIGERRNYAGTGVDKENNRIITTMLNEMDGFTESSGVLVIAATNSYSSLDPALIRPGRFDLKYNVPNPDLETRKKLIDLYTKKKSLEEDINTEKLAMAFEGLSSAAIETILNEAAKLSNLANKEKISLEAIFEASRKTNCLINTKRLR